MPPSRPPICRAILPSSGECVVGLKHIRLEHVRSRSDQVRDQSRSYVFQAFLRPDGELAIEGYSAVSRLCKVVKSEPASGRRDGLLLLTSVGWMFACGDDVHGTCLDRLEARALAKGDLVTIAEDDGIGRLFEVVSIKDADVEILRG